MTVKDLQNVLARFRGDAHVAVVTKGKKVDVVVTQDGQKVTVISGGKLGVRAEKGTKGIGGLVKA